MPFHVKDGWRFEKLPAGAVKVESPGGGTLVMDYDAWASVLASMCKRGESAQTFHEASEFHRSPHPGTGIE